MALGAVHKRRRNLLGGRGLQISILYDMMGVGVIENTTSENVEPKIWTFSKKLTSFIDDPHIFSEVVNVSILKF